MSDGKQAIQSQFGNAAANYRTSAVHAAGEDLEAMVAANPLDSTMRVLDAGCGAGHAGVAFAPYVSEVVSFDLTAEMLEQVTILAKERQITNIVTQAGDVESLPFDDSSFDLVISRYSAHHWLHPQAALREFHRVLKPNGHFILGDIMAAEDFAQDTFLQVVEVLRDPSHVRDFRISEWQGMMQDAGFSSEVLLQFEIQLNFLKWTQRIGTPLQNVDMLRTLIAGASDEVKSAFSFPQGSIGDNFNFAIPGAVLLAAR